MILDMLIVKNVGVFRGRHILQLASPSANFPVTSVLALNGSGKTTLLESLRLGLYGRRTPSLVGGRGYDKYLRDTINRDTAPDEGAAIEISFRLRSEGVIHSYCLRRSWRLLGGAIDELLEVHIDDCFDRDLTTAWAETIEQWLPTRLSSFCFFDGEQLAALADPEQSQQVLQDAVRTLLGLDLVDQLSSDLKTLERRRREKNLEPEAQIAIAPLHAVLEAAEQRTLATLHERGTLANAVERAHLELEQASVTLKHAGGRPDEQRAKLLAQRVEASEHLQLQEQLLRQHAYGLAPLLLVKDSLRRFSLQDPLVASPRAVAQLQDRDSWILSQISALGSEPGMLDTLEVLLCNDRNHRIQQLSSSAVPIQVTEVLSELATTEAALHHAMAALQGAYERLDTIDRAIERLPRDDDATSPHQIWEKALIHHTQLKTELDQADKILLQARRARDEARNRYQSAMEANLRSEHARQEQMLVSKRSETLRASLEMFRRTMMERHSARLGDLIADSFSQLHRKPGLIDKIKVDPQTFAMTLISNNGQDLPADRLSAGERQLLAVATIWAILRASGRPLPLVIDTPLGRLDSAHRKNLVERFFVRASHQVVLLATDTELDEQVLQRLEPHTALSYEITYQPEQHSSVITRTSINSKMEAA